MARCLGLDELGEIYLQVTQPVLVFAVLVLVRFFLPACATPLFELDAVDMTYILNINQPTYRQ